MFKKIVVGLVLLCCIAGAAAAQPPSFDPTNPRQVAALQHLLLAPAAQDKAGHAPFRSGVDPRDDGDCWVYQADSNYDLVSGGCSYGASPYNCVDNCYVDEQTCDDAALAACGGSSGDCGTNATCCENKQDACREKFNSCMANCG